MRVNFEIEIGSTSYVAEETATPSTCRGCAFQCSDDKLTCNQTRNNYTDMLLCDMHPIVWVKKAAMLEVTPELLEEISMDKKYTTKDGHTVRVLCTDIVGTSYPVVYTIKKPNDLTETILRADKYGKNNSTQTDYDLIEIKQTDWSKVETDTKIIYMLGDKEFIRLFSHYKNGLVYYFMDGCSSKSCIKMVSSTHPSNVKLA